MKELWKKEKKNKSNNYHSVLKGIGAKYYGKIIPIAGNSPFLK